MKGIDRLSVRPQASEGQGRRLEGFRADVFVAGMDRDDDPVLMLQAQHRNEVDVDPNSVHYSGQPFVAQAYDLH